MRGRMLKKAGRERPRVKLPSGAVTRAKTPAAQTTKTAAPPSGFSTDAVVVKPPEAVAVDHASFFGAASASVISAMPAARGIDTAATYYDNVAKLGHAADVSVVKHAESIMREFVTGLAPHSRIVDVGAGSGEVAALASQGGHTVTGIDVSTQMVAQFNARGLPGSTAQLGDARHLPLDTGSQNAAVSSFVLIHLNRSDGIASLRELRRVLEAGGTAMVATNVESRTSSDMVYAHRVVAHDVMPTDFHFWERQDLLTQVQANGFEVSSCRDEDYFQNGRTQLYLTLRAREA